MGRLEHEHEEEQDTDTIKSKLVLEICSIFTSFVSCVHHHHSHFIDWYRVIGVCEDAETDVIRRSYHKLALLLHPDKNNHPKAETAFKLISEAYSCLSDGVKRRDFNLKRWKSFCIECNRIPYRTNKSPPSKHKTRKPAANWSKSFNVLTSLRDIKERFKEEARVIESCLSRQESPVMRSADDFLRSNTLGRTGKESPVFNPADYIFQGYPHLRNRIYDNKPENWWQLQRDDTQRYEQRRGVYNSPIFEKKSDNGMFKSKSTCVRS